MRYLKVLPLAIALALPGCEGFVPNGNVKPKPSPAPTPAPSPATNAVVHRIELVIKQEGESRVVVSGDSTISVKSANASSASNGCECGCGKPDCTCSDTRDLSSSPRNEVRSNAMTAAAEVDTPRKRDSVITVVSPSSFRCEACELAVSSMRALGANVEHVKQDGHSTYPVIKNAQGKEYKLSDGYWRVGRDDVAAIKELAK